MLPASLKQVEYIETGTSGSYFETGITPSAATVVEFDGNAVSGEACLFGSRASMYASKYMTVFTSGGFYRVNFGGRNAAVSASYVSGVRHLFRQEAYTLYIDGTQVASGSTGDMSGAIPLIALGACRTGTSLDNIGPVRMYSMRIWQDGALVADYIPAKDASDAACIWDDVAQTTRYPTLNLSRGHPQGGREQNQHSGGGLAFFTSSFGGEAYAYHAYIPFVWMQMDD